MTTRDSADSPVPERGWVRSHWLAEKITSGELPAATTEITRQCDALFVGQDRLEDHVHHLLTCLALDVADLQVVGGARAKDMGFYLQRLLSLREMWARERC